MTEARFCSVVVSLIKSESVGFPEPPPAVRGSGSAQATPSGVVSGETTGSGEEGVTYVGTMSKTRAPARTSRLRDLAEAMDVR